MLKITSLDVLQTKMIKLKNNFPFKLCNNDELRGVLSVVSRNRKIVTTNESLAQTLPFFVCSDYEMLSQCLTNKDKFLELFENNSFTSQCFNLKEGLSMGNYSCRYYNEDSFNSMVPKHMLNSLKVSHLNIRSLNKHCHELKAYLACLNCDFDLMLLTEIGNVNSRLIEEVFVDYSLHYNSSKAQKGGAGILVRKEIFDEIELNENKVDLNCGCSNCMVESIFLDLKSNNNVLTVGSIYRHPSGNVTHFNESLDKCLKNLSSKNTLHIGGDINIDLLKTNSHTTQNYLDIMLSHNLIPNIAIPTRFTDRSATLIDHMFTRLPKSKVNNKITSGNLVTDISDHLFNFTIIDMEVKRTKDRPLIRRYTKENVELFKQNIESELSNITEITATHNNLNVNESYRILYEKLHSLLDLYFPRVRQSRKKAKDKEWITEGIKRSIKHRNSLYQIQIKNGTSENINKWKKYRNILNNVIKEAQRKYYQNLINQHNNSCIGLWKTLGSIICKRNRATSITNLKVNNKHLKDPAQIANAMNDFFINIGSELASKFQNNNENEFLKFMGEKSDQSMYMHKTNPDEVRKIIEKLKDKKSCGYDELSARFLKLCSPYISEPLANILNASIVNGIYPDPLKIASVTPVYKKGVKNDPSNYRPISVLSTVNKVFEKILHKRLYKYLSKFEILYDYQFGFREGHSTTQALVEITDRIKFAIDKNELTCGIFIDLTKAFDTVNHHILLQKMYNYGIRGNVYSLFKSYLSNRQQFVKVNNEKSDMKYVTCGVPQGSVLGPLLFIIYINDIANSCKEGQFRIFADDTGIFCHSYNIESLIAKAEVIIKNVSKWFAANKLTLNVSKTSYVIFKSKKMTNINIPNTISYKEIKINRESQVKYLGLILDEHMSWDSHTNEICNKLKSFFPLFYNIRHYLDKEHINAIFYTMIYSRIKYGSIVTGLTSNDNINKIQVMQNRLLKVLSHKHYRYSTNKLHNELSILKFEDVVKQEILSFVHSYVHDKLPGVFKNYFIHRHDLLEMITEPRKRRFVLPLVKKDIGISTVKTMGSKLFNDKAQAINLNVGIKAYRKCIKKIYLPYHDI